MKAQLVTRESLLQMLNNQNPLYVQKVVGRALTALLQRQTQEEQTTNETKVNNNIGFAGCDARSGSLSAKYYIKHQRLEDWMVERWVKVGATGYPRICKYAKQLNEIATSRSAKN